MSANASRVYVNAAVTAVLMAHAITIIDGLLAQHGNGVEIPNFRSLVLDEMMKHPLWPAQATKDYPSDCDPGNGDRNLGMWPLIRIRYAEHGAEQKPPISMGYLLDDRGRPSNNWVITDDRNLLRDTFMVTIEDNGNRFVHDMRTAAHLSGARAGDPVYIALTEGQDEAMKMGRLILLVAQNIVDDLMKGPPSRLRREYGWQNVDDAFDYLQSKTRMATRTIRHMSTALWKIYKVEANV